MLLGLLTKIKSNLFGVGAGLLAALAFFARFKFLKQERDKAEEDVAVLTATLGAQRKKEKIIKEEEKKRVSRSDTIKEEISKMEKGEKSEGITSLSNPNDF